jgi:hypothetical protein
MGAGASTNKVGFKVLWLLHFSFLSSRALLFFAFCNGIVCNRTSHSTPFPMYTQAHMSAAHGKIKSRSQSHGGRKELPKKSAYVCNQWTHSRVLACIQSMQCMPSPVYMPIVLVCKLPCRAPALPAGRQGQRGKLQAELLGALAVAPTSTCTRASSPAVSKGFTKLNFAPSRTP